MPSSIERFHR